MKMRWAIAMLGAAALAAMVVTTMWPRGEEMQHITVAPVVGTSSGEGEPAMGLTCAADAKPANLNFTMKDHTGADISLSKYKGKVLLLDFWATWCGPCKVEIPHFIEFQQTYGSAGLQVVGVSVDDTADKVAPYITDMKMNYPVLLGLNHDDVMEAYGPMVGIPVSVLISRDGRICASHTGLTGKDVFEAEIKALL